MEPISGLEQLARLLRVKSAERTQPRKRSAKTDEALPGATAPLSLADLEKQLELKLKELAALGTHPSLSRVVIESVLCWELGRDMRNEPKFTALVAQVQEHFATDPDLSYVLNSVLQQLIKKT